MEEIPTVRSNERRLPQARERSRHLNTRQRRRPMLLLHDRERKDLWEVGKRMGSGRGKRREESARK